MRGMLRGTLLLAVTWVTVAAGAAIAQAQAAVQFDVAAQPLADSLRAVGSQTNLNVLFDPPLVAGRTAPELRAHMTAEEALRFLLAGTGIVHEFLNETTVVIEAPGKKGEKPVAQGREPRPMRLARADSRAANPASPTDSNSAAEQPDALEEIIVTATKRKERLQDVPASIAVIGSQEIERRGAVGMQDYLRSIPSVNQIDNGALSNAIVIRGVTTTPQFENFASGTTVATYFGETPITGAGGLGTGGIDVRPVDIERIEVLRGPQGTTYGSASLSGALRIIPNQPQLDRFGARLSGDWSSTSGLGGSNNAIQGMVNLPLVQDVFGVRLVGYRYDESGAHRNIVGVDPASLAIANQGGQLARIAGYQQDDVGRMISEGGRLAALWRPSENLDINLNAMHQIIEQDGSPVTTRGGYLQARFPVAPRGQVRGETGEVADTDIDLVSAVVNYDLGWGVWTSTASWVDSGSVFAETVNFANTASTLNPSDFRSLTVETRLTSPSDRRFRYLGGVFYEDLQNTYSQTLLWPGPAGTSPYTSNPGYIYDERRDVDQRAVFGEVSFDLTPKLTATAGARFFEYKKNERLLTEGSVYGVAFGAGVPSVLASKENDSSYKLSVSYKATDRIRLYASWSDGFRLGRPTAGLPPVLCDTNQDGIVDNMSVGIAATRRIESDFVDNFELGGKFELLDRRFLLDAAVYYIDWTDLPLRVRAPAPCSRSFTTNIGHAVSKGVELQAGWLPVAGLRFDFGASYTNAELTENVPQLTPIPAFDGDRLPGSPEFSANLSAQYETTLAGYETFFRADSLYAGEFYGDLQQSPTLSAGGYAKVDVRAGVTLRNVDVELFVRNVTNRDAYTWRTLLAGTVSAYQMRPRTYGIQIGYRFE